MKALANSLGEHIYSIAYSHGECVYLCLHGIRLTIYLPVINAWSAPTVEQKCTKKCISWISWQMHSYSYKVVMHVLQQYLVLACCIPNLYLTLIPGICYYIVCNKTLAAAPEFTVIVHVKTLINVVT